jgi:hypothetical protein
MDEATSKEAVGGLENMEAVLNLILAEIDGIIKQLAVSEPCFDWITTGSLLYVPKQLLLQHYPTHIDTLFDRLPTRLREDEEIEEHRRCTLHRGNNGPSLLKKDCKRCCQIAFPIFTDYEKRLETFATWPSSLKQTPEEMSEAGFFYTGQNDRAVCYYCGGGLNAWNQTDVPAEEHAIWFNRCRYIRQNKGLQFVKDMRRRRPCC